MLLSCLQSFCDMDLKQYYGKQVMIIDTDLETFIGLVDDYFFPEDNENGEESIVITTSDGLVEFTSSDIYKIIPI